MSTQLQEQWLFKVTQNSDEAKCQTTSDLEFSIIIIINHRRESKVPTSRFSACTGPQMGGESSACQIQLDRLPGVMEEALLAAELAVPSEYAGFWLRDRRGVKMEFLRKLRFAFNICDFLRTCELLTGLLFFFWFAFEIQNLRPLVRTMSAPE